MRAAVPPGGGPAGGGPDLERFLDAQRDTWEQALAELRAGRKEGHWMWFVFPQLAGLGRSATARYYALTGTAQAREYAAHPVLGPRLLAGAQAVLELEGTTAEAVLGTVDAVKLRSSMTLFGVADPAQPVFGAVLAHWYGGVPDEATLRLLGI